jgi:hypothetical protein
LTPSRKWDGFARRLPCLEIEEKGEEGWRTRPKGSSMNSTLPRTLHSSSCFGFNGYIRGWERLEEDHGPLDPARGLRPGLFRGTGDDHYLAPWHGFAQYDVHPAGDRFLVLRTPSSREGSSEETVVVVNWFQELEERLRSAVERDR